MWPNCCWPKASLPRSLLAVLLLVCGIYGQNNVSDCHPDIIVKRNTELKASPGEKLQISCPVVFCPNSPSSPSLPLSPPSLLPSSPSASWEKIMNKSNNVIPVNRTAHIEIGWQDTNDGGISLLTFKSISRNDSGLYRCKYNDAVGHSIIVTVLEGLEDTTVVHQMNITTNIRNKQSDSFPERLLLYVYISAGIVIFVLVFITASTLLIRGCKGVCPSRHRKEEQPENQQYIVIQLTEQVSPRLNPRPQSQSIRSHQAQSQPTPKTDCIYDNAPARGPRRTCQAPVQPVASQLAVPEGGRLTYSNMKKEEEESGIMYATLNHKVSPRSTTRSEQPKEELSEYAAIRVS
ncbi:hypothetical protein UPYG_G00024990 [Umbra pygmaea]|uniref:Ig-like domain-containing protein n=1 Tax=Umbra pygmaea TaxID=75934 RepID=A0ABD0XLQ0_UMBPY